MLICAGFLIAWIPYAVVSVVSAFGSPDSVPIPVSVIPTLLAKSSAMYNPIIYQVVDLKNSCTKSSCFKALKERRHFRKTRYNVWDSFGLYFTCCQCPNRFPIICMCSFLWLVVSAKSLLLVRIVLVRESGCIYTESTLWQKQARCSRAWGHVVNKTGRIVWHRVIGFAVLPWCQIVETRDWQLQRETDCGDQ